MSGRPTVRSKPITVLNKTNRPFRYTLQMETPSESEVSTQKYERQSRGFCQRSLYVVSGLCLDIRCAMNELNLSDSGPGWDHYWLDAFSL